MMTRNTLTSILIILPFLAACRFAGRTPPPTILPAATPTHTATARPTSTGTPAPTASPSPEPPTPTQDLQRPAEAIFIREPASGSRLTGPFRVAGLADPTFEQNLVVRVVSVDGDELFLAPTTIQADIGQRGPFELEVPLTLETEQNIFIQVYATSARDGGITHLASSGVIYSPGGQEDVIVQEPQPEQIAIFQPGVGETISGGVVHVEGFALASFEQTLVIEVLDAGGEVVGSQPIIVQAPDLGQPGPYSADVSWAITAAGPGRVVVRDISPAFGGDSHRSSVEVSLEP